MNVTQNMQQNPICFLKLNTILTLSTCPIVITNTAHQSMQFSQKTTQIPQFFGAMQFLYQLN